MIGSTFSAVQAAANVLLSPRFATVGLVLFGGLAWFYRNPVFTGLALLFAVVLVFSLVRGSGSAKVRQAFMSQPPENQEFLLTLRREGGRSFSSSKLSPRPGVDVSALEEHALVVTKSSHTYGGTYEISDEVWDFLAKQSGA